MTQNTDNKMACQWTTVFLIKGDIGPLKCIVTWHSFCLTLGKICKSSSSFKKNLHQSYSHKTLMFVRLATKDWAKLKYDVKSELIVP